MAPKKKVDSDDLDNGDDDSDFIVDSEEEEKPKKRKAPAKPPAKKPAKKPAAKVKSEDDEDDGSEDEKPKKKKTPAKPKVVNKKFTQPEQLDDGFTAHPPSLLYKQFGTPVHSEKIAAFDLDGTLINSLSGNTFAESADDWYTYNDNVAVKLKQYHDEGYKIVIFTNQGGIKGALAGAASEKIRGKVTKFLATMQVPALVMMATNLNDEWRKPDIGMWKFMCSNLNGGVAPDLSKSFFVGDNHNNADEGFAANAGLKYRSESEEFGPPGPKPNQGGDGPNAGLVQAFLTLAEEAKNSGKDSAVFAARTYNKVAGILKAFPKKIVDTPACLKEVNALAGVGKGSMSVIKDYLKDGCLKPKEIPAERMGAAATGGKEREQAMQFM